jgi:hypothetical protein
MEGLTLLACHVYTPPPTVGSLVQRPQEAEGDHPRAVL